MEDEDDDAIMQLTPREKKDFKWTPVRDGVVREVGSNTYGAYIYTKSIKVEDKVYSYGGKSKNKSSKKRPPAAPLPPPPVTIGDEKFPTDLLPGTKKTDFEWTVENGIMREVVNQGNRRVCWTIASSREFGGRLIAAGKVDPPLCLSALHLLVGLIDKVDPTGGLKKLEDLRAYLIDHGAVLEEDCSCPQHALEIKADTSKDNPVTCTEARKDERVRKFKVRDLIIIKGKVDEKEIMRLLKTGPVAVGIDTFAEFSKLKGDVIFPGAGKNSVKIDEHMFIVYGYGTRVSDGTHYWKVQNSAGKSWGVNGCRKVIRQISRGEGKPSLFRCYISSVLLDEY